MSCRADLHGRHATPGSKACGVWAGVGRRQPQGAWQEACVLPATVRAAVQSSLRVLIPSPAAHTQQALKAIEAAGTLTGGTKEPVVVARCGELIAVPDSKRGETTESAEHWCAHAFPSCAFHRPRLVSHLDCYMIMI